MKNYHIDKTTGGVQDAQFKFYSSSMEKSGMDVVHWCAAVLSMAADLKEVTELEINDKSCLSVMVRGLLPEFMPIVTLINMETNITYIDAQSKLFSFAKVNHILDLKKGGAKSSKDNIFSMEGKPECKGWKMNRCMYGDSCKHTHIGPGAHAPLEQQYPVIRAKKKKEQEARNQNGATHLMEGNDPGGLFSVKSQVDQEDSKGANFMMNGTYKLSDSRSTDQNHRLTKPPDGAHEETNSEELEASVQREKEQADMRREKELKGKTEQAAALQREKELEDIAKQVSPGRVS